MTGMLLGRNLRLIDLKEGEKKSSEIFMKKGEELYEIRKGQFGLHARRRKRPRGDLAKVIYEDKNGTLYHDEELSDSEEVVQALDETDFSDIKVERGGNVDADFLGIISEEVIDETV